NFSISRFCTLSAYTYTAGYFTTRARSLSSNETFWFTTCDGGMGARSTPLSSAACATAGPNPVSGAVKNSTVLRGATLPALAISSSSPQHPHAADKDIARLTLTWSSPLDQSRTRQHETLSDRNRCCVLQCHNLRSQPKID